MAQVQLKIPDINSYATLWAPFFAQQDERERDWRDRMVAIGSLEDLASRISKNSQTYKDYAEYRDRLEQYGVDVLKGSHVPGVMADKAAAIYKDYGRITGKMERINEDLKLSRTERAANMQSHPGAIFQQNDIYDNIDEVANGTGHINNRFTDSDTVTKIMQTQAEYIGQALDEFLQFNPIELTNGYSLEAIQRGGVAPDVLYDIWVHGKSDKLDFKTNELIKMFMQNAKDAIGYNQFDAIGRGQIDGVALNSLTAMLRKNKFNVIDSGKDAAERNALSGQRVALAKANSKKKTSDDGGYDTAKKPKPKEEQKPKPKEKEKEKQQDNNPYIVDEDKQDLF